MTVEKALEILKSIEILSFRDKKRKYFMRDVWEAKKVAIKALEQQPCEDCISRKAVLDYLDKMPSELTSDGRRMVRRITLEDYISVTLPPVTPQQARWIPCSESLPENAKHKGAFCPKYYVMTEFGQTEGWYNPDKGCWYVLLWFMDARFETWNISLERGDVPKLVKNVPVTAWMPLPEPYKVESEVQL